ncbi:MAG: PD-(D/E)XK nuclease family protein [Candidatus Methanomethylophilaceae archaeon]|nr:PD-(D/E)XK nuclease family protein [Candidatus Methanomethylophilaceae archaeon]
MDERAVPMRRAKTIEELYAEVRDYDLVMTVDAPLETALNGMVDRPYVGRYAITPRHLALQLSAGFLKQRLLGDLEIVTVICEETGLDFRFVHGEVQNIREIRRYTHEVRKHLYTENARQVFDSFDALPTLERVMHTFRGYEYEGFKGLRVAVIGLDFFDSLDKNMLPEDFDEIDPFTDGEFSIGEIREVGNDRLVARDAVDLIDPANPEDYAIVLNSSSPIAESVRAALYLKGLPFINSLNVRDITAIRDFIQFLRLSVTYDIVRVRDVKEIFTVFRGRFRPGRETFLLGKLVREDMNDESWELSQLMRDVMKHTFSEVAQILFKGQQLVQVNLLLEQLRMQDLKVGTRLVMRISYAVENVNELHHSEQIPEFEKKGVLIADCMRSTYVDRPVVIFMGLGRDWNPAFNWKPYLDVEDEYDINDLRMQILLQQGQRRVYCVNSFRDGERPVPCESFKRISRTDVRTFDSVGESLVPGVWASESAETMPERMGTFDFDAQHGIRFSKSTYNNYVECPRRFMFYRLIGSSSNEYTEFGDLSHEFAELYLCYPELVREKGTEYFVDVLAKRYSGISSPALDNIDRGRIRCSLHNVMRYIDGLDLRPVLDTKQSERPNGNWLMQQLGLDDSSSMAENEFSSNVHPIHGKMDLYADGQITDYKTGNPATLKEIAEKMGRDDQYYECQPLMYLALSDEREDSRRIFHQLYTLDNQMESTEGQFDINRNLRTVRLSDKPLGRELFLTDPDIRVHISEHMSAAFRGREDLLFATIEAVGTDDVTGWSNDPAMITYLTSAAGMNQNKSNQAKAVTCLRVPGKCVVGGLVVVDGVVIIPRDAEQRFLAEVDAAEKEAESFASSSFPVRPRKDCRNCDYRTLCMNDSVTGGEVLEDE